MSKSSMLIFKGEGSGLRSRGCGFGAALEVAARGFGTSDLYRISGVRDVGFEASWD